MAAFEQPVVEVDLIAESNEWLAEAEMGRTSQRESAEQRRSRAEMANLMRERLAVELTWGDIKPQDLSPFARESMEERARRARAAAKAGNAWRFTH